MKADIIQEYLDKYQLQLHKDAGYAQAFVWENIKNFQDKWDINAPDFAAMYDRSLESSMSRQLWRGERGNDPKQRMIDFIKLQPDWVRSMFRNLFNEEQSIDVRSSRFLFGCDEMMQDYRRAQSTTIETSHLHEDFKMLSLYLGFRYPEKYALYNFDDFKNALIVLKSPDIPVAHDLTRYYKILKVLEIFINKRPSLLELHKSKLQHSKYYQQPSRWLAWDFFQFIAKNPN